MKKVIIVTGGNRGIGKEICRQLAEAGHDVILCCRKKEAGEKSMQNTSLTWMCKNLM